MKNKKGFTLIELLAVIVILAIIALIAVPVVLNMIENARRSAAKSSAYGYIDAIDNNNKLAGLKESNFQNIPTEIPDGSYEVAEISIKIKGKKPTSGSLTITNGKVSNATNLCFYNYPVSYNGTVAEVGSKGCSGSGNNDNEDEKPDFSGTKEEASSTDTHKGIIYLDPTDLSRSCNESNSVSTTGTKIGCMKWYIYDDTGNYYKLILDHNTTGGIEAVTYNDYIADGGTRTDWNNNLKGIRGPITTIKQLKIDTKNWLGNPRLINADEVAHIVDADSNDTLKWSHTKNYTGYSENLESDMSWFYLDGKRSTNPKSYATGSGWQKQIAFSQGASNYAWLFDYTIGIAQTNTGCTSYGCNINDSGALGYWTNDYATGSQRLMWAVTGTGKLSAAYSDESWHAGLRPVIKLPKCIFNSNSKCSGWLLIDKTNQKWIYYNSDGTRIKNGWGRQLEDLSSNKQDYYFENGYVVKGWKTIEDKKYYFSETDADNNGYIDYNKVYGGSVEINGTTYTFDNDGVCTSNNC